jgi:hypothetical protein
VQIGQPRKPFEKIPRSDVLVQTHAAQLIDNLSRLPRRAICGVLSDDDVELLKAILIDLD